MAVPVQRIGGDMHQGQESYAQIDRAYTISRVTWMLDNYHALLTRKPPDPQRDVVDGVVSIQSQWWNAQVFWRKVDRKSDLDTAIDRLRSIDGRMYLIMELRYRAEPRDSMQWEEIAASLGIGRTTVWRLANRATREIALYLGGVRDS